MSVELGNQAQMFIFLKIPVTDNYSNANLSSHVNWSGHCLTDLSAISVKRSTYNFLLGYGVDADSVAQISILGNPIKLHNRFEFITLFFD